MEIELIKHISEVEKMEIEVPYYLQHFSYSPNFYSRIFAAIYKDYIEAIEIEKSPIRPWYIDYKIMPIITGNHILQLLKSDGTMKIDMEEFEELKEKYIYTDGGRKELSK